MDKKRTQTKVSPYLSHDIWKSPNENAAKLLWLLKLRWLALLAQSVCIFPGLYFGYLDHKNLIPFITTIVLLVGVNYFSIRRYINHRHIQNRHFFIQMFFDLIALTILLLLSGGKKNPFSELLLFHAALSPMLLTGVWNLVNFLFLALAIAAIHFTTTKSFAFTADSQTVISLTAEITVALAIWQFTSWLSYSLRIFQSHTKQLEQHENRMDRLRAIGALASGFNHEFATPLNTVKLKLNRIRRNLDEDTGSSLQDDFKIAEQAIEQCSDALKNFHKAQIDSSTYSSQSISISSYLQKICENWQLGHQQANLVFTPDRIGICLCSVPPLPLSQTIINILDNSYQAHPQSSIQVETEVRDNWFIIKFSDDGPGFPDIVLKKIGEPFLTTKKDGTGLGLYNAYHLLEAIGGKLIICNGANRGAEISLLLPTERIT